MTSSNLLVGQFGQFDALASAVHRELVNVAVSITQGGTSKIIDKSLCLAGSSPEIRQISRIADFRNDGAPESLQFGGGV